MQIYLATFTLASLTFVYAQTLTSCNPLNTTCPPSAGLAQWFYAADFTGPDAATRLTQTWNQASGTKVNVGSQGLTFNISNPAQAPAVTTDFTFLFGRVDVRMQAAPGTGIVSSLVLESQDLDEIDFVVLGGNTTSIETNYYGKGANNVMTYVAADEPQSEFHTYTIDWTSSSLVWSIDGQKVRTLAYSDAKNGNSFPQTPMALKIGSWDCGKPGGQPGTIAWAGGLTDFSESPFVMYVESVNITNYNPANSYNWTDSTGSFDSIKASNTTNSLIDVDTPSLTAASIVGGPTLVTATASTQGAAVTGGSPVSSSSSSTNAAARPTGDRTSYNMLGGIAGLLIMIL